MAETNDLEGIIEIRDEQIDTEAIMRRIRENIQKRRETAEAQGIDFDAFVKGLYREEVGHFDAAVYYNLRRANTLYDRVTVKQYVSPRHAPLIGPLIQRVRAALHDLVIYYVNMLGSKQVLFNESLVYLLNGLVQGLEKDAEELTALRQEVQELRAQLAAVQAKRE
jgi:hypothetical protein